MIMEPTGQTTILHHRLLHKVTELLHHTIKIPKKMKRRRHLRKHFKKEMIAIVSSVSANIIYDFLQLRFDRGFTLFIISSLCISFAFGIKTARVYAILTGQLLFTAGTIHAFHLNPGVRDWMLMHPAGRKGQLIYMQHTRNVIECLLILQQCITHYHVLYLRAVPLFGLLISTIAWWITLASENIRQSSFMKWPLLLAFTIGESIAVGFISSVYAYSSVMKAMMATAMATVSVTVYTLLQKNPKYDLSQW